MNIERIRFGISSIYRPSAISKLVREDKNVFSDEAVTFEGEKRQAKDKEQESTREKETNQQTAGSALTATIPEGKASESMPLDVVA